MKRLAIMFPGVGYTCDKPLLYYSAKYFEEHHYEVRKLKFSGFPENIMHDASNLRHAFHIAYMQSYDQLKDIDFSLYDEVVMVGKSIGTYALTRFLREQHKEATVILLTPLEEAFAYVSRGALVISGLDDPWVNSRHIQQLCKDYNAILHTPLGNHSLEVPNDVFGNLRRLEATLRIIDDYITNKRNAQI